MQGGTEKTAARRDMSHAAVVSRDTDRIQQLGRAMLEKAKTCFSDTTFMREGGDPAEEAHQTK